MTPQQTAVRDFMRAAGQECPAKPAIPSAGVRRLRSDLIYEELKELWEAQFDQNLVGIADALGDLLYVVLGGFVAYGIDAEPVFDEIHRSNMSKIKGGWKDASGKWRKGEGYTPPDLARVVRGEGAI